MFLSIPMALLLTVAVPTQEPADAKAAAVAPFVGEEVAVVVHIELTKWDAQTFFRRVVGKLADEDDLSAATKLIDGSVAALKAAGAKDLFLLFEPADMPGFPVAVVPLVDGADGKAIAAVLTGSCGGIPSDGRLRDDPRRRRCRHACPLGQHAQHRTEGSPGAGRRDGRGR